MRPFGGSIKTRRTLLAVHGLSSVAVSFAELRRCHSLLVFQAIQAVLAVACLNEAMGECHCYAADEAVRAANWLCGAQ